MPAHGPGSPAPRNRFDLPRDGFGGERKGIPARVGNMKDFYEQLYAGRTSSKLVGSRGRALVMGEKRRNDKHDKYEVSIDTRVSLSTLQDGRVHVNQAALYSRLGSSYPLPCQPRSAASSPCCPSSSRLSLPAPPPTRLLCPPSHVTTIAIAAAAAATTTAPSSTDAIAWWPRRRCSAAGAWWPRGHV